METRRVLFENQTFLVTQWFVTANDCFSLHPGGCGLKSTSVWLCWGLWFMLMAEQFKVNRSNLESDLPLRGGTLSRVLVKPRFLEHGFWQMQCWVSCFYLYCDFVLRLEVWVLRGLDWLFAFLVYQVERTVEMKLKYGKVMGQWQREDVPRLVRLWLAGRNPLYPGRMLRAHEGDAAVSFIMACFLKINNGMET